MPGHSLTFPGLWKVELIAAAEEAEDFLVCPGPLHTYRGLCSQLLLWEVRARDGSPSKLASYFLTCY